MLEKLKKRYIGTPAFYKMALAVAVPIMIQNGITNFVSMLDNIMVGLVGTVQMTGVAIANQIIFVFNLAIFGAVAGAGIFGAQFFGCGDHDGVRHAFRFKLISSLLITGLAVGIFFVFGENLIRAFLQGEGDVENIEASLAYGVRYLRIMLVGFVPFTFVQCYAGTLRESGETLLPMKAGIASVLVNLCFNTLLIFGFLGFPALGSDGAAIATVISRFVEAFIVIIWTHRHSERMPFIKGAYRSLRIPVQLALDILKKALPLILNETFWALSIALLNQCYSMRGYDVVAAVNITSAISNVFNVTFLALGNAIGIIVGQMLGAGKTDEAVDTSRKLIVFSVTSCLIFGSLMAAVSPFFPLIYKTSTEIRSLATSLILVVACTMPINALANACYFTLRSGGRAFITVLFDSVYACGIVFPVAFILSRFTSLPIIPLYLCCQLLEIGKCVIGVTLVAKKIWVRNIVKTPSAAL